MRPQNLSSTSHIIAAAAAILTVSACAARPAADERAPSVAATARPFAPLVPQNIIVTPVLAMREGDSLRWAQSIPNRREFLRSVDTQIQSALRDRGLTRPWIFPEALARAAQRNPGHSTDPYQLAMEPLRRRDKLAAQERLPEPLASQLRTMVALHDSRFVILPLEIYFEPVGSSGEGRAVMRLAFADARLSEIQWVGDVRTDAALHFDESIAAELGTRFADLVIAP
jgi:hypothetical protein